MRRRAREVLDLAGLPKSTLTQALELLHVQRLNNVNPRGAVMADAEDHIVRRLLSAISDDADVSQRKLSHEVGIAVGSVNWYLKRCVNKGLIKLKQAPVKRYLYYLTPQGLETKARLTAAFLHSSFELYRLGRKECHDFFRLCAAKEHTVFFLAGDGDLAEIAVVSSLEIGACVIAVIDADSRRVKCAGIPVVSCLDAAMRLADGCPPHAILLTALTNPNKTYGIISAQMIERGYSEDQIHVPRVLNFKPTPRGRSVNSRVSER